MHLLDCDGDTITTSGAEIDQLKRVLRRVSLQVPLGLCRCWLIYTSGFASGAAAAAAQLALDFEDGDEVTQLLTIEDELYVMECRACSTQVG
jgi:hypothetical protein